MSASVLACGPSEAATAAACEFLDSARVAVDQALHAFLVGKQPPEKPGDDGLGAAVAALRVFLSGPGKRVRPLFCQVGWRAVTDMSPSPRLTDVSVGLELVHGHALVHDDVVDRSRWRRGRPTLHVACAGLPGGGAWRGVGAAVFLGDLAAVWAEECFQYLYEPDVPAAARTHLRTMRTELIHGQLLDLAGPPGLSARVEDAFAVIHAKTVAYTVRGPLLIGAAAAGADRRAMDALAGYARLLGEAFQLQDDLEDVTADEGSGEDLLEGKHTVVVALAAEGATAAQRKVMGRLLGRAEMSGDELADLRAVIIDTGAVGRVRAMIAQRRREALAVAARGPFTGAGRALLAAMTDRSLPGVALWQESTS
ncbi:polyprenyl synthetase family protein [Streptomyces sp. NPDC050546]|uniref:polyprenyl synthetase family protein n=1 Tax=Streptomyces sp. NPDC050546 TaxID=3365628 RepID=UPI00379E2652